ncbi:MAG: argininosuccinate lyase [Candidatus Melainabacteria bacterium]
MAKLWAGRLSGNAHADTEALNRSIAFDQRLFRQDIRGSMAHARMLGKQGILDENQARQIILTLEDMLAELKQGQLAVDPKAEDIHSFVEAELTRRIGDVGKRLHTGRSRNDQVALDLRLYLRDETDALVAKLSQLSQTLNDIAGAHTQTILPGYTHLQRAQPITLAMHMQAYVAMIERDTGRLQDARRRMNQSPLGAGALAGSTFPLDRAMVAQELGFDGVAVNPLDAVSDRDFVLELLSAVSILMMHLSRLAEEVILWCSQEFGFVSLDDAYSTGSSMMPQKKNPDVAELVRGKTGRVYGHLLALLTTMKALPLAYNKDMQEDKEAIFDTLDTVNTLLPAFTGMLATMTIRTERMREAAGGGFVNATDLADYLVGKGLPFRDAYQVVGQVVQHCVENKRTLETLPLEDYRQFSDRFAPDLFAAIALEQCVAARQPSPR